MSKKKIILVEKLDMNGKMPYGTLNCISNPDMTLEAFDDGGFALADGGIGQVSINSGASYIIPKEAPEIRMPFMMSDDASIQCAPTEGYDVVDSQEIRPMIHQLDMLPTHRLGDFFRVIPHGAGTKIRSLKIKTSDGIEQEINCALQSSDPVWTKYLSQLCSTEDGEQIESSAVGSYILKSGEMPIVLYRNPNPKVGDIRHFEYGNTGKLDAKCHKVIKEDQSVWHEFVYAGERLWISDEDFNRLEMAEAYEDRIAVLVSSDTSGKEIFKQIIVVNQFKDAQGNQMYQYVPVDSSKRVLNNGGYEFRSFAEGKTANGQEIAHGEVEVIDTFQLAQQMGAGEPVLDSEGKPVSSTFKKVRVVRNSVDGFEGNEYWITAYATPNSLMAYDLFSEEPHYELKTGLTDGNGNPLEDAVALAGHATIQAEDGNMVKLQVKIGKQKQAGTLAEDDIETGSLVANGNNVYFLASLDVNNEGILIDEDFNASTDPKPTPTPVARFFAKDNDRAFAVLEGTPDTVYEVVSINDINVSGE